VLEVARALAERGPVVLMCYTNPILARGPERFAEQLEAAGVSGLIVPDLPFEETPSLLADCDARGVALVPLVAPTTPEERLSAIVANARGFVYLVSVAGTTGERAALSDALAALLARTASHTDLPVAVGFGISTPEQALAAARAGADGVIVGSRLVRAADEADRDGRDPAAAVADVIRALAGALHA
jgi:tryptophan synthase alpha chain